MNLNKYASEAVELLFKDASFSESVKGYLGGPKFYRDLSLKQRFIPTMTLNDANEELKYLRTSEAKKSFDRNQNISTGIMDGIMATSFAGMSLAAHKPIGTALAAGALGGLASHGAQSLANALLGDDISMRKSLVKSRRDALQEKERN